MWPRLAVYAPLRRPRGGSRRDGFVRCTM